MLESGLILWAMIPISDLSPVSYNPRKIAQAELDLLAQSIVQHSSALQGWDVSDGYRLASTITVNVRGMRIVGGHQRIKALEQLGQDWVADADVTWVDLEPDSARERALNLALNAQDVQGYFDWNEVAGLLEGMDSEFVTGFAADTLATIKSGDFSSLEHGALKPAHSDEWSVPRQVFDPLNEQHDFTVDAAASPDNTKCECFWSREDNGLEQDWTGERVWCAPPRREASAWVEKAAVSECLTVMVLPADTGSKWFHRYVWEEEASQPKQDVLVRILPDKIKASTDSKDRIPPAPFPAMVVTFKPKQLPSSKSDGKQKLEAEGCYVEIRCTHEFLGEILPTLEEWQEHAEVNIA